MHRKPFKNSTTLRKMNSQQLSSKLTILPLNKTVVFYSPVEGRDVLVRTGTLSEGNSFVHAIFHAYSKDYAQMEKKGRMKLVSKLYSKISDKFMTKRWEEASTSVVAQVPFQENISQFFADFYRFVTKDKTCKTKEGEKITKTLLSEKKDLETYQILSEIAPLEDIEKNVLQPTYEQFTEKPIAECKVLIRNEAAIYLNKLLSNLGKALDRSKHNFLLNKMEALCDTVTEYSEKVAYKKFSKGLKDVSISVDPFTIGILAEKFNRDIYFIDARSRMPYIFGNKENVKGRKSIVVMWIGGVHYEIVGKLLPGNRIQRQFEKDDPLIKRINTFLYRPELVSEQYPNLIPYLGKTDKSESSSESESESRSKSGSKSRSQSSSRSNSRSKSQSSSESGSESRSRSQSESRSEKALVQSRRKQPKRRSRHRK